MLIGKSGSSSEAGKEGGRKFERWRSKTRQLVTAPTMDSFEEETTAEVGNDSELVLTQLNDFLYLLDSRW